MITEGFSPALGRPTTNATVAARLRSSVPPGVGVLRGEMPCAHVVPCTSEPITFPIRHRPAVHVDHPDLAHEIGDADRRPAAGEQAAASFGQGEVGVYRLSSCCI